MVGSRLKKTSSSRGRHICIVRNATPVHQIKMKTRSAQMEILEIILEILSDLVWIYIVACTPHHYQMNKHVTFLENVSAVKVLIILDEKLVPLALCMCVVRSSRV